MLVLINPMLSQQNLNSDSNYVLLRAALSAMTKLDDDLYFVLPFPANQEWRYYRDELAENDHVLRMPKHFVEAKRYNNVDFDTRFWSKILNGYPPDVVWNHSVEIGHLLAQHVASGHETGQPPVVNHHHYPLHPTLPTFTENSWLHFQLAQIVGSLLVSANVFHSNYARWMQLDNCDAWRWPYARSEIERTSRVIPLGCIDVDRYERCRAREKHAKTTIVYNHRLALYKRWRETFELFEELHSSHDFDVVVTSGGGDNAKRALREFEFARVVETPKHDEYLRELSKCHINVTNTAHETFCISIVESMAYGQAIVAPRGLTFPELLGDDYPYLFSTREEQKAQLAYLLENEDELKHTGDRLQNRALREFNSDLYAKRLIALFKDVIDSKASSVDSLKHGNKRALLEYFRDRQHATLDDLKALRARSSLGAQAFPPTRFAKTMRDFHYESKIADSQVQWVRR